MISGRPTNPSFFVVVVVTREQARREIAISGCDYKTFIDHKITPLACNGPVSIETDSKGLVIG